MNKRLHFTGVLLKDIFLREIPLIIQKYRPFLWRQKENSYNVFIADGSRAHGGMFDRLKGLISIYALSKAQQKDFKIYFTHPFYLSHFLLPHQYDWRMDEAEMYYRYPASRPIVAYGEAPHPFRVLKRRKGVVHYYYGFNSLAEINQKYHTSFEWGQLYRELFQPSPQLSQLIEAHKNDIGSDYIAVHCRIMNLLGDKVESFGNQLVLSDDEQAQLKSKLFSCIQQLAQSHPHHRILLATDSNHFSQYIAEKSGRIYIVPGDIKHIDTTAQSEEKIYLKLFLDYYMIAEAAHVYSIIGGGLYPSAFPEYAAMIGGKSFQRISCDQ